MPAGGLANRRFLQVRAGGVELDRQVGQADRAVAAGARGTGAPNLPVLQPTSSRLAGGSAARRSQTAGNAWSE